MSDTFQYEYHAIPTIGPRGIKFRSRLEAVWAYFFECLGWNWEYEPIDLKCYIPDFIISSRTPTGDRKILVEIKPFFSLEAMNEESGKKVIEKIKASGWKEEYLILGCKLFDRKLIENTEWPGVILGILGNNLYNNYCRMFKCKACDKFSFAPLKGNWDCRMCGINEKGKNMGLVDYVDIDNLFNECKNKCQYHTSQQRQAKELQNEKAIQNYLYDTRELVEKINEIRNSPSNPSDSMNLTNKFEENLLFKLYTQRTCYNLSNQS